METKPENPQPATSKPTELTENADYRGIAGKASLNSPSAETEHNPASKQEDQGIAKDDTALTRGI